jgi:hypothetical protein
MGIVSPLLLALDIRRTVRVSLRSAVVPVSALGRAAISFASFFYHYRWWPAANRVAFPDPHPLNYPGFSACGHANGGSFPNGQES